VTAYFQVPEETRIRTRQKLGVDRVYQAGEILSLPRYLVSGIFPTSSCQPYVRIVRFNFAGLPGLVNRHRMAVLADGFKDLAGDRRTALPTGFAAARSCKIIITDRGLD